jgi:3-oxoacyl-[acyl-carrier-protein] synthase II
MGTKRVVVTGLGTVNPLGNTVDETWDAILERRSGIGRITRFDASHLPVQIAGEVKSFDSAPFFSGEMAKAAKRMDTFCHYAVAAMAEASGQAGVGDLQERHRIGISVGSGIGGLNVQHQNSADLATKGYRRVSPFYIPMSIGNMASGILSIMHEITGPNLSLQTACATANHSIAMGMMLIQAGHADVMVAGGAESTVNELAIAGFANMRALSTRNDSPETASRPYDANRDGFVLSEGAAILILEEYEHARARGAEILCEVLACGMSGDAFHFVQPDPSGRGVKLALEAALEHAAIPADRIGYINTHGTATPAGDVVELGAIYEVIRDTAPTTHIGSTKSYHGHVLGATSGVEAVITIRAMREGVVPPNLNIETLDPECPPVELPTEFVEKDITAAISNSFGFGVNVRFSHEPGHLFQDRLVYSHEHGHQWYTDIKTARG